MVRSVYYSEYPIQMCVCIDNSPTNGRNDTREKPA